MSKVDDGERDIPENPTLRDWFAGQALAGIIATNPPPDVTPAELAQEAFYYADAMIDARKGDAS